MTRVQKLALLGTLYFAQGLPFGFFTQALPVLLRKEGVSLAAIGSTSLLAAPWALKFLWAPLVDRHGSARFGRRRSFIVPLQAAAVVLLVALSFLDVRSGLVLLFVGVFLANLIAASQDIATDALAVDVLKESERGLGNGMQVAGYRVGMIVGGGLLLVVFERLGWSGTCFALAGIMLLISIPIVRHREAPPPAHVVAERIGFRTIVRTVSRPDMRAFAVVLLVYKAGDALGTSMVRPLLVDRGYTLADIGWILGTLGFVAGLTGALVGGAWLPRLLRSRALLGYGLAQAVAILLYAPCALGMGPSFLLVAVCTLEHFVSGMATAALMTSMMDRTRPEAAATEYTVQASLVVLGSGLFAAPSGLLADAIGYPWLFALAGVLGVGGAITAYVVMQRSERDAEAALADAQIATAGMDAP